jgi:N-acetylglutamate synthase-like GNAT family acetyltransferase
MTVEVRRAIESDVDAIYAIGHSDAVFAVSETIRFYEKTELAEWAGAPCDNVLLIALLDGAVVGFLFCKIMSSHWAMLDNLYVVPAYRMHGTGNALLHELDSVLKEKGVKYLSTLSVHGNRYLAEYLGKHGFSQTNVYNWLERFL